MSREENLEKLNKELQKEIKEECQVFCIMVRIRKALEHYNLKDKFPLLNFYCNWIFHTYLDNEKTINVIINFVKSTTGINGTDTIDTVRFVGFSYLKKEFNEFLTEYNLNNAVITDAKKWKNFRQLLLDILIDTPLEIKNSPIAKFSFVRVDSQENSINFRVDYSDRNKSSTKGSLDVSYY